MTPRPGRRTGRTRLQLKHVEARHRAIAKVNAAETDRLIRDHVQHSLAHAMARPLFETPGTPLPSWAKEPVRPPLELPGHHLQRAAAENA